VSPWVSDRSRDAARAGVSDRAHARAIAHEQRAQAAAYAAQRSARDVAHALDVARQAQRRCPDDDSPKTIRVGALIDEIERAKDRATRFLQQANGAARRREPRDAESYARAVLQCANEARRAAAEATRAAR
jgi:hypothetical protein